jgi:hypothetical protein
MEGGSQDLMPLNDSGHATSQRARIQSTAQQDSTLVLVGRQVACSRPYISLLRRQSISFQRFLHLSFSPDERIRMKVLGAAYGDVGK